MTNYNSFGLYPKAKEQKIVNINWRNELPDLSIINGSVLPYGMGKSYGDSCLNSGNTLLTTRRLNHIIEFNPETGLIKAESGILLSELIEFLLPKGFFLPVTPGTKLITLGGAVANDVHGKNHHKSGSFGCFVKSIDLYRSAEGQLHCSIDENTDLFKATIGGLGLTGLMTTIEFQAIKVPSPFLEIESIRFDSLDEFFEINEQSDDYEFAVAWLDCSPYAFKGRGIYQRGDFCELPPNSKPKYEFAQIPYPFKFGVINSITVAAFNSLYFNMQQSKVLNNIMLYEPYFYPLDKAANWNYAYGENGFLQYQFVIPTDTALDVLQEVFSIFSENGLYSFLTVLKSFGVLKSPGLLSFPREGVTLAIDFKMEGQKTLKVLELADKIILENGGKFYPAKDARMSPKAFKQSYPNLDDFVKYIDPKFSSDFWRRVNNLK